MTLRRLFRFWLLVLIVLSVAAVSIATIRLWILMFVGPVLVASWYVTESHRGFQLPRFMVNLGALSALAFVIFSAFSNPDIGRAMELLGIFVLVILILRQFQVRTLREDAQQLILSSILVISAMIQSDRFLFGIVLLAWVVVLIYVIMLYQVFAGVEKSRSARRVGLASTVPLDSRFGPLDAEKLRRTALASITGIILVSVVVFIFFPRQILFQSGMSGGGVSGRSGFNETVDLVSSTRISSSRREVFVLRWIDPGGIVAQSPKPILLRGAVLSRYDASLGRWINAKWSRSSNVETSNEFTQLGTIPIDEQRQIHTVEVQMRSLASDVIFSPWGTLAIATATPRLVEIDRSTLLLADAGSSDLGNYASYSLRVQPFPPFKTLRSLQGESGRESRQINFPIPSVREIAIEALESMDVSSKPLEDESDWVYSRRVSRALAEWLEIECAYTTDLRDFIQIPGEDPIVSFLTRYRFGHCEYFASALTAMCRSLGIESRLITGFVAMEYDEGTSSYIVRESNAHAWTEVRTGQFQWETLDPSPRTVLEELQASNSSWLDGWRWVYDSLDFFWNSNIIGYDQRSQQTLGDRFVGGWQQNMVDIREEVGDRLATINRFFKLGVAGYVWMASIFFLALCFIVVFILRNRKRRRILSQIGCGPLTSSQRRRFSSDLAFWTDALKILRQQGFEKNPSETPRGFAARVSQVDASTGIALNLLVDALYHIRFGGHHPNSSERAHAMKLVRKIRSAGGGGGAS